MSSWRERPTRGEATRGRTLGVTRPGRWGFQGRTRSPPPSIEDLIDRIEVNDLLPEVETPQIKEAKYVASYNWLDVRTPVILVPGSPPKWSPPTKHYPLNPDSVPVYRDINSAKHSIYPLEPAIRSLLTLNKTFKPDTVDIVGCGSTLGNLLRFTGSVSKSFRFDVDVVGDTVFFIRRENSPTEMITDLVGYGQNFPVRYTTWDHDMRNSCSHQRLIQYDFGGLNLLVRSETDGYLPEAHPQALSPQKIDSLESAMANMNLTNPSSPSSNPAPKLEIELQGCQISQSQIFDIKTRTSQNAAFDMNDILPRLWLNQTPNFLITYHTRGLFSDPEIRDVRAEVLEWEAQNSARLGRFHALVKRIVDVVIEDGNEQVEVSWDGHGPLLITKQAKEHKRALPSDLLQWWEGK